MLLEDKNAVIYGAAGAIGGAVARAFAREGASVFLTGRTQAKLGEVAEEIRSAGGVAETAQVDALEKRQSTNMQMPWKQRPEALTSPSTSLYTRTYTELRWWRWRSRITWCLS